MAYTARMPRSDQDDSILGHLEPISLYGLRKSSTCSVVEFPVIGLALLTAATSKRPRSSLHSTKRSGASAWSLCWTWILAGARRITLWVVLNLINLLVSADGGCRRTMSPGGACWCWEQTNRNCGS